MKPLVRKSSAPSLAFVFAPLIWLGVVALALAVGFGLLARLHPFFELFVHFPAQYLVVGLALAVTALLARRYVAFALALGLALSNLAPLWPYVFAAAPRVMADGPELRVVSANLNHMHAEPQAVKEFLQSTDADIVILTELALQLDDAYEAGARRFGHVLRTSGSRHNPAALMILARRELRDAVVHMPFGRDFPIVEFRYCLDEAARHCLAVIALHPVRPREDDALRDRMLGYAFERARQAGLAKQQAVLAGDLNVTPFSPVLARFAALGLRDAALGRGWQPTWPVSAGIAGIPIDHVLVSPRLEVRSFSRLPPMGSDHRPLQVELRLPAKSAP